MVTFGGGLLEELVFRLLLASAIAGVVWTALRRASRSGPSHAAAAEWIGTASSALVVGIWHAWMISDPTSSDTRVIVVNLVSNVLYGWTFWRRGLEMAVLTHGTLNAALYLGLPLLH